MPRLTVTERAPLGSGSTRRAAPEPPATSRAGRPRASTTIRATVDRADATRRSASTPAQAAVRERALQDAVLHATRLHAAPSRTTKATVAPLTSTDRTLPASASVRVPAASGWQTYASADPASITTASGTAHTSRRTRTAAIALPPLQLPRGREPTLGASRGQGGWNGAETRGLGCVRRPSAASVAPF